MCTSYYCPAKSRGIIGFTITGSKLKGNAGHPDLTDDAGSRSDMGAYGGPWRGEYSSRDMPPCGEPGDDGGDKWIKPRWIRNWTRQPRRWRSTACTARKSRCTLL